MIAHVFVDAENIPPSVTFKVVEHFGREHTITKVDIVAKEEALPYRYRNLDEEIYRIRNCFYGKNSADTWLCIEIVRAIIDEPDLELIIIVSSDKDFLPAIKFAVDFEKKILVVSNGAGHRTLIEQMKILEINPASVDLKDYRLKFGEMPRKLEEFLPKFSFEIKKFFFDREERIKFILVKRGGKFFEVPFINGMGAATFGRMLRELGILSKGEQIKEFIFENFLKLWRDRVYFKTESEMWIPTSGELVENYFDEHSTETRNIFIKHNERLFEIPFVDGMPLDIFGRLLRERKIIGKGASPALIAEKSLLKVSDRKIFLRNEEEQETIYGDTIKDVKEYFSFHATELKKIFIKHNGKLFEIPFVEGISLELFGKLLRERKIIGKNTSAIKVAAQSLLEVRNERIFLYSEEALENIQNDSLINVDEYLNEHAPAIRNLQINHGGQNFSIPFVNEMPVEIFGKLLRERKVIGLSAFPEEVIAHNLLTIRDGKIFIGKEENSE